MSSSLDSSFKHDCFSMSTFVDKQKRWQSSRRCANWINRKTKTLKSLNRNKGDDEKRTFKESSGWEQFNVHMPIVDASYSHDHIIKSKLFCARIVKCLSCLSYSAEQCRLVISTVKRILLDLMTIQSHVLNERRVAKRWMISSYIVLSTMNIKLLFIQNVEITKTNWMKRNVSRSLSCGFMSNWSNYIAMKMVLKDDMVLHAQ